MDPVIVAGLSCFEVLAVLGEFLDGGLAPDARGQVTEHLRGCAACAAFGGSVGAVVTELRGLLATDAVGEAAPPLDEDIAQRLHARLTGALDPR